MADADAAAGAEATADAEADADAEGAAAKAAEANKDTNRAAMILDILISFFMVKKTRFILNPFLNACHKFPVDTISGIF